MPLSFNRLMTLVETRMSIVKISIIFKIDLESSLVLVQIVACFSVFR